LVYGPAQQILESTSPLFIVIPSIDRPNPFFPLAETIASNWYLNGRGDAEIVHCPLVVEDVRKGRITGNLIVLGRPEENEVTKSLLQLRPGGVQFDGKKFSIHNKQFSSSQTGILFLHPYQTDRLALIFAGTDFEGLTRAVKLMPNRTGLMVPDWIVTSSEMDWKGYDGVLGAGYWDNNWRFNSSIGYI